MSEENQGALVEQRPEESVASSLTKETIQVVKATIFPNSTDAQLRLFCHKCLSVGVHPLDGLLHPSVYQTKDGPRVVIVASIDFLRASSNDSGEYDGQDRIEYIGEGKLHNGKTHPILAVARVYRKNNSRPVIGEARWEEFYPENEKKRQFWDSMPHNMLGKCAEAQALRKGFPKKLHEIYSEDEMHQAIGKMNENQTAQIGSGSTKPVDVEVDNGAPGETLRKQKKWISEAQEKRIYALAKTAGVEVETVKAAIKSLWKIDHFYMLSWAKESGNGKVSNYDMLCAQLEKKPEEFKKYEKKAVENTAPGQADPAALVREMAGYCGIGDDEKIDSILTAEFGCDLGALPTGEHWKSIVRHFEALASEESNHGA